MHSLTVATHRKVRSSSPVATYNSTIATHKKPMLINNCNAQKGPVNLTRATCRKVSTFAICRKIHSDLLVATCPFEISYRSARWKVIQTHHLQCRARPFPVQQLQQEKAWLSFLSSSYCTHLSLLAISNCQTGLNELTTILVK